jgi:hypothetical protein
VNRKQLYGAAMFLLVAALVPILEALVKLDPATMGDWRTWAIGVGAAAVRATAAAGLARLMERRVYFVPELPAAVEEP